TDVAADTIVAASRLFHYGVSTRGARIVRVQLDAHRSMREDGPVQLVPETAGSLVGYRLEIDRTVIDLARLPFQTDAERTVRVDSASGERTVRFEHQAASGFTTAVEYVFRPDSYLVDVNVQAAGVPGTPQL